MREIARERNAAVVLCSHLLAEIESVCDDVVILSLGQVVAKGSVADVIGHARGNGLRIRVPTAAVADAQQVLEAHPDVARVTARAPDTGWLQVEVLNGSPEAPGRVHLVNNGVLAALIAASIPILTVETEGSRLHEVFLQLTEEAIQ